MPSQWPTLPAPAPTMHGCLYDCLKPFFGSIFDDPTLFEIVEATCRSLPVDVRELRSHDGRKVPALDLTRGPTLSFKDLGVRVAVEMYRRLFPGHTVLCATSGDTGAAVAHACAATDTPCEIYFPRHRISAVQEEQIRTASTNNPCVRVHDVEGDFDACQRRVKARLARETNVLSANSISLARLLPQVAYYHWLSGQRPGCRVVVPSGNFGNATSALAAKVMGSAISSVVVACNANVGAARFLRGEDASYAPRPTVQTPASAMDVGDPSNLWRFVHLRTLVPGSVLVAEPITDATHIREIAASYGVCPHTAVALCARDDVLREGSAADHTSTVVVATASALKFP